MQQWEVQGGTMRIWQSKPMSPTTRHQSLSQLDRMHLKFIVISIFVNFTIITAKVFQVYELPFSICSSHIKNPRKSTSIYKHASSACHSLSRAINSYIYNQDNVSCGFTFRLVGVHSVFVCIKVVMWLKVTVRMPPDSPVRQLLGQWLGLFWFDQLSVCEEAGAVEGWWPWAQSLKIAGKWRSEVEGGEGVEKAQKYEDRPAGGTSLKFKGKVS